MAKASALKKKKTTRTTSKSGTCRSVGSDMKDKTNSEITMNLKKTVKPHSGVQLGTAIDDDNNVPYKTMDEDVIETNDNDLIDKDDKEEDTEDSVTYSRNKKMCLSNNKSTNKISVCNMEGKWKK